MNPRYKIIIFALILIISGGAFLIFKYQGSSSISSLPDSPDIKIASDKIETIPTQATSTKPTSTSTSIMQSTDQLFAESPDYDKAYLIYPTANASAKKALAGFNFVVTKSENNDVIEISLTSKTQSDQTQSFKIIPGQKIYFVEKSFSDDSVDVDKNYSDDYIVAVDEKGFILK
ncbi:MAG: hypothetical protein WCV55_00015 [Candidatus Paceibacterota bacterium]